MCLHRPVSNRLDHPQNAQPVSFLAGARAGGRSATAGREPGGGPSIKAYALRLPGVLEEIEAVAGRPTAITMALAWGGREVHIPKLRYLARHPDHPLARLLALEGTALAVSDYLGGSTLYLPRARRACAVHLAAAGATPGEIATRLALSPSAARRYCRGVP